MTADCAKFVSKLILRRCFVVELCRNFFRHVYMLQRSKFFSSLQGLSPNLPVIPCYYIFSLLRIIFDRAGTFVPLRFFPYYWRAFQFVWSFLKHCSPRALLQLTSAVIQPHTVICHAYWILNINLFLMIDYTTRNGTRWDSGHNWCFVVHSASILSSFVEVLQISLFRI